MATATITTNARIKYIFRGARISLMRFIAAGLLLLPSLLLLSATCMANESYIVTHVYDGDTVELSGINGKFNLRLTDIDAPERNQAYGKESRRALTKLCKGKNISVNAQMLGTDKYSRSLGKLQCNHVDASLYLAEHGYAWHYAKYSSDVIIQNAAFLAREKGVGLWKRKNPLPPWIWREKYPQL